MISSLIDELNKSADEWNSSNMFELARMCREAADTITELRGALQVASVDYRHLQDENAKLREELEEAKHDLQVFSANLARLGAENAKLRELLDYMAPIAWYAASERERDRMRELGVEVES